MNLEGFSALLHCYFVYFILAFTPREGLAVFCHLLRFVFFCSRYFTVKLFGLLEKLLSKSLPSDRALSRYVVSVNVISFLMSIDMVDHAFNFFNK